MGRQFGWLWTAYAVSAYGSGLGFGAFPLIAVLVLHASPAEVSALSAVGPAVGALIAVPLAPWMEFRRKRPVMIAMDLSRFAIMMTIPLGYAFGWLGFVQLLVVSTVVAAAKIAFNAASGAFLKALVPPDHLLVANARFESTNWSSIAVGPPIGGAAIGLFGPVTTVVADAVSYLLSALGISAIRGREEQPRPPGSQVGVGELLDGWRHILAHPGLRPLYLNNMLVAGLIMATEPLLAVLLLGQLGFPPWQYGLAFAAPCVGGLIGSRLARRVVGRLRSGLGVPDRRHAARDLADRSRVRPSRYRRSRHRDRRRARDHRLHEPVQPGPRDLLARTHSPTPDRPHPVGLVHRPAGIHRHLHRARRAARQPHQRTHGSHRDRPGHPRHPAPSPPRTRRSFGRVRKGRLR